jgi:hypothetical protein
LDANGQQIFDVILPFEDGVKRRAYIALPETATPLEFLQAVYRCPDPPLLMRIDAAKWAAVFVHERRNSVRVKVAAADGASAECQRRR